MAKQAPIEQDGTCGYCPHFRENENALYQIAAGR